VQPEHDIDQLIRELNATAPAEPVPVAPDSTARIDRWLHLVADKGGSDLLLVAGAPPSVRVGGVIVPLAEGPLDGVDIEEAVLPAIAPHARRQYREASIADASYRLSGLARFRINLHRERGRAAAAVRMLPARVPRLSSLGLPPQVELLAQLHRGLVLIGGPTGSGKSTTLAALVEEINRRTARHIVTIEDPVEVLHADKRSIVDQREVGTDTPSAVSGLEHALRQDPDVIVLGHLTDEAAATAVLQAAEIGHLVIAAMSTVTAVDSIDRCVELFPPHRQRQARTTFAATLRGVVSQRLLPRAGGRGRVPAVEILVVNTRVRERIGENRLDELEKEMTVGELYGMQTFDQSVVQLYRNGLVERVDAVAHSTAPGEMRFALDRADVDRERQVVAPAPASAAAAAALR